MTYTVLVQLNGALASAVAVEWTDRDAPEAAGTDWQPCIRVGEGLWRFASRQGAEPRHLRGPGPFANLAIRYRLEPAGPWSAASADRKEIVIRTGEEGEQPPPPPPPLPPVLVALPLLAGTGKIGSPVTAAPGTWTGAESVAFQWCRDGADIAGATEAGYTPVDADDRTDLTCRVVARGPGGETAAVTASLAVTHVAPSVVTTDVLDEIHDVGTGPQVVETAAFFTGRALVFAAAGAGTTIDAATGRLTIATDAPVAGETVTVTAANSGGSALLRLLVTVEAAPVEEPPVERAALGADSWRIAEVIEDPVHAGRFTAVIEVDVAEARRLFWDNVASLRDVAHPTAYLGLTGGKPRFRMRSAWSDSNNWHTALPGEGVGNIAVRWSEIEAPESQTMAGSWQAENGSPWSVDRKGFTAPAAEAAPPPPPPPPAGTGRWQTMPRAQRQDAEGRPLAFYDNGLSWYTNVGHPGMYWMSLALDSFAGDATADARVLAHFRNVARSNSQGAPGCRGGYRLQFDVYAMGAIAVMRHTPRVWNAMSATERNRGLALLKAGAVAGLFMSSDRNPYISGAAGGGQRTLDGQEVDNVSRDWNPNYRLANPAIVACAVAGLGESALASFANGYSHSAMVSELESLGLSNTAAIFRRNHSNAPSAAQIETALRQFRRHNQGIAGWRQILITDTNDCFARTVQAGLNGGRGISVGGQWRGVQMNAPLNGQPFVDSGNPVHGQLGMLKEFESNDGGGARSAVIYCLDGARLAMAAWGALAVAGLLDRSDAATVAIRNRMNVGMTDLDRKWTVGYREHSKGGSGGGNDNWTLASKGQQHGYSYSIGIWRDVLRPWFYG